MTPKKKHLLFYSVIPVSFLIAISCISILAAALRVKESPSCYSPNNLERRQIICREIDHELNVACYWMENEIDIFCIQLKEGE